MRLTEAELRGWESVAGLCRIRHVKEERQRAGVLDADSVPSLEALDRQIPFDPRPWERELRYIDELRRLQALLLGLADASGKVLGRDLAAIAQERGVTMAQAVAEVIAEVEAIRKEQTG